MPSAILTDELIRGSLQESNVIIPGVTVGYIRWFLHLYEDELLVINNVESIRSWIPFMFRSEFANYLVEEIGRRNIPQANMSAAAMKEIILSSLAGLLLRHGEAAIKNRNLYEVVSILPWDVQAGIVKDRGLFRLFGFNRVEKSLPVTSTILGREETQNMSLDTTAGFLTFCKAYGVDCYPRMFGYPLEYNDLYYRYVGVGALDLIPSEYSVEVVGIDGTFKFNGLDFMNGMAIASLSTGAYHRNYWKNLRKYNNEEDTQGTPVHF